MATVYEIQRLNEGCQRYNMIISNDLFHLCDCQGTDKRFMLCVYTKDSGVRDFYTNRLNLCHKEE